ncbi:MAG: hypothetical protein WA419_12365, partial [Silvibacterium sp.]
MPRYFGAVTLVLVLGMVLGRSLMMRQRGIRAMHFGKIDKKDYLIPPFALFYFYLVFANVFGFPTVSGKEFFPLEIVRWAGVAVCLAGLL